MPVSVKDKESRELTLLIPCIVLGSLLLVSLVFIAVLLLRAKGRYGRCDLPRATAQDTAVVRSRHPPVPEVWKSPGGLCKAQPAQAWGNLLMVGRIFQACIAVAPTSGGCSRETDSAFVLGVGRSRGVLDGS